MMKNKSYGGGGGRGPRGRPGATGPAAGAISNVASSVGIQTIPVGPLALLLSTSITTTAGGRILVMFTGSGVSNLPNVKSDVFFELRIDGAPVVYTGTSAPASPAVNGGTVGSVAANFLTAANFPPIAHTIELFGFAFGAPFLIDPGNYGHLTLIAEQLG